MKKPKWPEGRTRKDFSEGVTFLFFVAVAIFVACFFLRCGGKKYLKETESAAPPAPVMAVEETVGASPLEYSGEFSSGEGSGIGYAGSRSPIRSARVHIGAPRYAEYPGAAGEETDPREALLSQLNKGVIASSFPVTMIEGQSYTAYLRIDDKASTALTEGLDNPSVVEVNVSATMKATLTAGKDIEIDTSYSSGTQLRKVGEPTEWKWGLKPLKSGTHKMKLKVVCILKRQGFTDETYDLKTYERELVVYIDPWYRVKNILKKFWSIIMGMLVSSTAVAWLFKKVFTRKKKKDE